MGCDLSVEFVALDTDFVAGRVSRPSPVVWAELSTKPGHLVQTSTRDSSTKPLGLLALGLSWLSPFLVWTNTDLGALFLNSVPETPGIPVTGTPSIYFGILLYL